MLKNPIRHISRRSNRGSFDPVIFFCVAVGFSFGVVAPLFFSNLLSLNSIPGHPRSDFQYYFWPLRCFLTRCIQQGAFPLWNPHLFCGYPVVESVQSALIYPPNFFALWLSPVVALNILTAAHLVLNYLAWLLCLRGVFRFHIVPSSLVAALANLTAILPYRIFAGHLTVIFSLPWFPVLIASAMKLSSSQRSTRWLGVAAIAAAAAFTSGAPQYALFSLWGFVVVCLATSSKGNFAKSGFLSAAALLLGALLATPQLAATSEYIPYSARSGGWGVHAYLPGTLSTLWETFLAAPFGNGVTELHLNERGVWDTAGYLGTIVLVLAFVGLVASARQPKQEKRIRAALALIGLGLYLMLGGWLPGFSALRENQRAVVIVHAGMFVLVACGLDQMVPTFGSSFARRQIYPISAWAFVASILGIAVLAHLFTRYYAFLWRHWESHCFGRLRFSPSEGIDGQAYVAATFGRSLNWALVWLSVAGSITTLAWRWPRGFLPLLALAMLLDPFIQHLPVYRTRTPIDSIDIPAEVNKDLDQIMLSRQHNHTGLFRMVFPTSLTNRAQCFDLIGDAGGYDPLMPHLALARRNWTERPLSTEQKRTLYFNTVGIGATITEPFAQPESIAPRYRLMRLVVHSSMPAVGLTTITTSLSVNPPQYSFGPVEDSTHTVANRETLEALLAWFKQDPGCSQMHNRFAHRIVRSYGLANPNSMRFFCISPQNALLVVSSTWLPGWRVEEAPNRRLFQRSLLVNGWMIGYPIPAGASWVAFRYAPPSWRVTVFFTLTTLAFLLVLCVPCAQRSCRRTEPNQLRASTPTA